MPVHFLYPPLPLSLFVTPLLYNGWPCKALPVFPMQRPQNMPAKGDLPAIYSPSLYQTICAQKLYLIWNHDT